MLMDYSEFSIMSRNLVDLIYIIYKIPRLVEKFGALDLQRVETIKRRNI
jgi:hypothetical protein